MVQKAVTKQLKYIGLKTINIIQEGLIFNYNGQYGIKECGSPHLIIKNNYRPILKVGKLLEVVDEEIYIWEALDNKNNNIGKLYSDTDEFKNQIVNVDLTEENNKFEILNVSRIPFVDSKESINLILENSENLLKLKNICKIFKKPGPKLSHEHLIRCTIKKRPELLFNYEELIKIGKLINISKLKNSQTNILECNLNFSKSILSCILSYYPNYKENQILKIIEKISNTKKIVKQIVYLGKTIQIEGQNLNILQTNNSLLIKKPNEIMYEAGYNNLNTIEFSLLNLNLEKKL